MKKTQAMIELAEFGMLEVVEPLIEQAEVAEIVTVRNP